ncbi:MAG: sensor histidine kinase [Acidimicrobiia bacterium]|nr:sensor histidine kinase [Acidimicrobiia bacterium]
MTDTSPRPLRIAGDILFALAGLLVMMVGTVWTVGLPEPLGRVLLIAAAATLVFRRRWPVVVMWAVISLGFIYDFLGYPGAFYTVAIVMGIYSVAAQGWRWTAVAGAVITFVSFGLVDFALETGHLITGQGALWFVGWLIVAVLLGEVSRSRRDFVASIEQRAIEAERTRQEETLRRVGEERMRIARELHDVLAHSISIINVQAGAAAHHLDSDPEKAREAISIVRNTGKEAIQELRSSLGVLRGQENGDPTRRRPTPGLGDLEQLMASARRAGPVVEFSTRGNLDDVPPDVALTVYRIVQESLTNVTRHGGDASATVTIERDSDTLTVTVEDDGIGMQTDTVPGLGIAGMTERAAAHGGSLETGPSADGGFRVVATIPLTESS